MQNSLRICKKLGIYIVYEAFWAEINFACQGAGNGRRRSFCSLQFVVQLTSLGNCGEGISHKSSDFMVAALVIILGVSSFKPSGRAHALKEVWSIPLRFHTDWILYQRLATLSDHVLTSARHHDSGSFSAIKQSEAQSPGWKSTGALSSISWTSAAGNHVILAKCCEEEDA
jgi:hypothetical protein